MLVSVLAILPFAGSLGGEFLYDDHVLIEARETIHALAGLGELWRTEFWHDVTGVHLHYYRPLVTSSLALDWAAWSGNPTGFHATNLALHAVVTWLVLRALRRWTESELAAVTGALLWAWHPSKAEAVAWISGRTDLLCTLGMLLALEGAVRRWRGDRRGVALEVVGTLVAYLSKESAVVLPGLVAVEAWAAAGRPGLTRASVWHAVKRTWPQVAAAVAYLGARTALFPIAPSEPSGMGVRDALLFSVETVGEIARVVVRPWPLTIERAPMKFDATLHLVHERGRLALAAVAVALLGALIVATRKRRPGVAVGLAFAAFAFIPVANVVPSRLPYLFAERFAYTPLLGVALAVASARPARAAWARAWGAVGGCVALLSASACARHTIHLHNDAYLWTYERELHPDLPAPYHWGFIHAVAQNRLREALEVANLGYRQAPHWFVAQPFRVDFALHAAQAFEELIPDRDTARLAQLAAFYATFFSRRGIARLDTPVGTFELDAGAPDAARFRTDQDELSTASAFGARALARAGDCEAALAMLRPRVATISNSLSRVTAARVLARCGAWDEAFAATARLPTDIRRGELESDLRWARGALAEAHAVGGLDSAMMRSRAATLLGDRRGAYESLGPFREAVVADAQGAVFYARAALAAGYDDDARAALAAHQQASSVDTQLADWTRELGRE